MDQLFLLPSSFFPSMISAPGICCVGVGKEERKKRERKERKGNERERE
jgi:hypothetical protein